MRDHDGQALVHVYFEDEPAPGGGYIVAGMPPDVEIVSSGAQLLLSEEFRSQIQVDEND